MKLKGHFLLIGVSLLISVFCFAQGRSDTISARPCTLASSLSETHQSGDNSYLGISLIFREATQPLCIFGAYSDIDARRYCDVSKNRLLNSSTSPWSYVTSSSNNRNETGVYYCASGLENPRKSILCTNEMVRANSKWERRNQIEFQWRGDDNTGECYCGVAGTPISQFRVCNSEADASPVDVCNGRDLSPAPAHAPSGSFCKCQKNQLDYPVASAEADCAAVVVAPAVTAPTQPTEALRLCVQEWTAKSNECKTKSTDAVSSCSVSSDTSGVSQELRTLTSAIANSVSAQDTCFRASTLGTSSQGDLSVLQDRCNLNFNACQSACGAQKFQEFEAACRQLVSAGPSGQVPVVTVAQQSLAAQNQIDTDFYNQNQETIRNGFTQGTSTCGSSDLAQAREALNSNATVSTNAITSATQCMCQLSSTATNCKSIPTAASCNSNPSLEGCTIYSAISVCSAGANYDAKLCECQISPNAAGCSKASSGGLVGFASAAAIKAAVAKVNSSSLEAKSADANSKDGVTDLSSAGDSVKAIQFSESGDKTQAALSTAGESGATAATGHLLDNKSEEKDLKKPDGLLNTLFDQAKIVGKALGITNEKENGDANTNDKLRSAPLDLDKYRPKRRIASGDIVGSKNMDIWKMMNNCVQGESCVSNINGYLTQP